MADPFRRPLDNTRFDPAIGVRVKEIREARGEFQKDFLERLAADTGLVLSESELSKREKGRRGVQLHEVRALAQMDPEHRGMLWILYGITEDPTRKGARPPHRDTGAIVVRDRTSKVPGQRRPGRR